MKIEKKPHWIKNDVKNTAKVKTLDVHISVASHDLGVEVRKAFDLAKSAGQELNLSFSGGTC